MRIYIHVWVGCTSKGTSPARMARQERGKDRCIIGHQHNKGASRVIKEKAAAEYIITQQFRCGPPARQSVSRAVSQLASQSAFATVVQVIKLNTQMAVGLSVRQLLIWLAIHLTFQSSSQIF